MPSILRNAAIGVCYTEGSILPTLYKLYMPHCIAQLVINTN